MTDLIEKTLRNLYIRNYLFVIFEEMARDTGCSVDYLVNEAMRQYARKQRPSRALDSINMQDDFKSVNNKSVTSKPDKTLYLWFNDQRYAITHKKYVIGRGGQSSQCDLVIPDSNISRRHCVITFLNGEHIIKDLNSTNGIEYQGNRIPYKKIKEGDTFFLCDYKIYFTYQSHVRA